MWENSFKPMHSPQTEIDGEMRTAFADWIAEHYGIHVGLIEFDFINPKNAKFTLSLGSGSSVEFFLHNSGKIESTLVIHGSKETRMPLPAGQLPPDKETFACNVARETCEAWKSRAIGWHPGIREMFDCLKQMAKTVGIDPFSLSVGGLYADGEQLDGGFAQYEFSMSGLQQALVHARAMVAGAIEYLANTPLEYDEGDLIAVIFPGDHPLESGEWLTTAGSRYSDWVADMPVTYGNENNLIEKRRWRNVTPLFK